MVGWGPVDSVPVVSFLFTLFFLVGVTNSVNLIDGHDGLAAGICLIASAALVYLAASLGATAALYLAAALTGACLSFLAFNFPPGKIFMGDTGSLFLGLSLGLISSAIASSSSSFRTTLALAFILGVPFLDTLLAVTRRVVLRVPIFRADHLHMHHVLCSNGLNQRQTLGVLCLLQGLVAGLGIIMLAGYDYAIILGLTLLAGSFVFFFKLMVSAARTAPEAKQPQAAIALEPPTASRPAGTESISETVATSDLPGPSVPSLDKAAE